MKRLTKRVVEAARATAGDVFLWEADTPGFALRVKPSGTKSFLVQYRNANGRSKRLTIGKFGVFTVEEARDEARLALAEAAKGFDPAENRKLARGAMLIADLCREYLDQAVQGLILTRAGEAKSATTLYSDKGRIERHIIPLIGKKTVEGFTTADARRFQRDVIAGKSAADVKTKLRGRAIVKGGAGTAARTMGLLGGIFSYAVGEGYRRDNPVKGVVRPKDRTREWRLDDAGYRQLGKCLAAADAAGESWQRILAIRTAALTGCRLDEIEGLLKVDIDAANSALRLGDTKTGKSVRPIGSAAVAILNRAASKSNSKFVFPSITDDKKHHTGLTRRLKKIAAKDVPGITCHGLRHSFSSTAEDLALTIPTIKALIGHSRSGVTEGYIHKLDPVMVSAADLISKHIQAMMNGKRSNTIVHDGLQSKVPTSR